MIRWGFVALATMGACSSFTAASSTPAPDGGTMTTMPDASAALDASTADATPSTTTLPKCGDPTVVLCDDFEGTTPHGWSNAWTLGYTAAGITTGAPPGGHSGNALHATTTDQASLVYVFATDWIRAASRPTIILSFQLFVATTTTSLDALAGQIFSVNPTNPNQDGSDPWSLAVKHENSRLDLTSDRSNNDTTPVQVASKWQQVTLTIAPKDDASENLWNRDLTVDGAGVITVGLAYGEAPAQNMTKIQIGAFGTSGLDTDPVDFWIDQVVVAVIPPS